MHDINVKMVQLSDYQWQIVSEKGYVIQGDLSFPNVDKANEYAKNYTSSFVSWDYTLVTLEDKNGQD